MKTKEMIHNMNQRIELNHNSIENLIELCNNLQIQIEKLVGLI